MTKEPEPTPEQTFPAAYYKDGATAVAATQEQADTLEADGWSSEAPDPSEPAKPPKPSHPIADRPDREPDRDDLKPSHPIVDGDTPGRPRPKK